MSLNIERNGWRRVKLGDVTRQVKTKVDPKKGEVGRYVAGEHMDTDQLRILRWGTVGDGYLGPAFHVRFEPGQVLYGSRRTYLRKVALADFDGVCANTTFVIETKDSSVLLPGLLPFIMTTEAFHTHSKNESKGSVNPYVNWPDIAKYEFDLPPLREQKRISDLLWTAERNKSACNDLLHATEALADAAFNRMSDRGTPATLQALVESIEAGKSPVGANDPALENERGVLKVSAVSSGTFFRSENKRLLNPDDFDANLVVKKGDLLVSRANALIDNVGVACLVSVDAANLMLSDKTLRVIPKAQRSPRVLLQALRSPGFREHVAACAGGTGAKNISQAALLRGPIVQLPSADELALESQLNAIDVLRDRAASQVTDSAALAKLLANRILGGEG